MAVTIINETIVPINIVAIHSYLAFVNFSKYMCLRSEESVKFSCSRAPTRFFIWQYSGPNSEISDTKLRIICGMRNFVSTITLGLTEVKHMLAEQVLDIATITIQNAIMHSIIDNAIIKAGNYAFSKIISTFTEKIFLDKRVERGQMKTKWVINPVSKTLRVEGGPVLRVNGWYKELVDGIFYIILN
ncbi:hypothetical protein C1645_836388 [Glomus cerebriforme]|uniref:Uncharacterized protein n=1 Tax=Glomus cerebriforme TaxID=658196 RepID=A0A397S8J2_9GLOM|nr:hypothetical protein C1645_836388 [Glomus cerebriforme]